MTFDVWKRAAIIFLQDELGFGDDLFSKTDPYDVGTVANEKYRAGVSPEAFVREAFEEDFLRREHDAIELEESLAYEGDE